MSEDIKPFMPLGEYNWPSSPVNRGVERLMAVIKKRLTSSQKDDGIDPSRLSGVEKDWLDQIAAPPANSPLSGELSFTLSDWIADPAPSQSVQVIVLPPCDGENFLESWAGEKGFGIITPPTDIFGLYAAPKKPTKTQDIRVIPRLEDWFLRSIDGMGQVRALLNELSQTQIKTVIGCNSWAWQYLRKSCEIDAALPQPIMFQSFDESRLRDWLSGLSSRDGRALNFKNAKSGKNAFEDTDEGVSGGDYMNRLAKRSLGIPWVAWRIWRASLHVEHPEDPADNQKRIYDDVDTFWVSELKDFALPGRKDQNVLMVLHALLIHNGLTATQIAQTVPLPGYNHVLSAVIKSGLVERFGDVYHCAPHAYPAIRSGLSNAGYPMDEL